MALDLTTLFPHESCVSSKLEGRVRPDGSRGVYALQPIAKGEILMVWGGRIISAAELEKLPRELKQIVMQVEEDYYLSGLEEAVADWVNHSCNPNAGLSGQIVLLAMRPIETGEEICFDYAMCDGSCFDEFECDCGAPNCRRTITGNDWQNPELWERYAGYFMPYLQRRIDRLKAAQS
ncbi:MAG TPA: SET domain-containing protein-lysine N-methyltransferase [Anaerolineaceae bacterium]|nr:SET domain-containing protein [Longilinea sp.]HOG79321.1 SET domain-containing protein-lysine N-methyltransferase [Anaerolineaceae bacterium]HQF61944.1 SET domain-containing protein-lysine N-methyltransferase [Anaerolineaceae bacterium]HQH84873.1 SET domain-containing protein-lysine N-methyltransferase [Anaerolineaceae bacterium]